jgi:radical SAM superfamily enzyme YgiQ (UPF0313 family)
MILLERYVKLTMTNVLIFNDMSHVAWSRSLGAYRVATALRRSGFTTQVVEHFLWAAMTRKQALLDAIDKFVGPDTLFVGFSVTFFQQTQIFPDVERMQRYGVTVDRSVLKGSTAPYAVPLQDSLMWELKERALLKNPKVKFVVGGSARMKLDLKGSPFDVQIIGYADRSVVEYTKYLQGKNPFFQLNGGIVDYDQTVPGYDVNDAVVEWTDQDLVSPGERLPIELARGCIFKCKFCTYSLNGKKRLDYTKSLDVLRAEVIHNYEKWGITHYWTSDDTFNDHPDKVQAIYDLSKSLPFKMRFRSYLRLDLIEKHQQTIEQLQESGLDLAIFGIESLNYENNKLIGKGIKPERALTMLDRLLNEFGWKDDIMVHACFIAGLPYDTHENIGWMERIFSEELKADWVQLTPLYMQQGVNDVIASEFDRNYSKYGYEFLDDKPGNWTNVKTGFTFADAVKATQQAYAKNARKNSIGEFYSYHKAMSKAEMYRMAHEVTGGDNGQKWRIHNFMFEERMRLMDDYFPKLMNL